MNFFTSLYLYTHLQQILHTLKEVTVIIIIWIIQKHTSNIHHYGKINCLIFVSDVPAVVHNFSPTGWHGLQDGTKLYIQISGTVHIFYTVLNPLNRVMSTVMWVMYIFGNLD